MNITIENLQEQQAIIHLNGRMDAVTSAAAQNRITEAIEQGVTALVVNLENVTFMDSSGLRVLVTGMKALRRKDGDLAICHANSQIRTALRLTLLDKVFPNHDTAEEALNSITSK